MVQIHRVREGPIFEYVLKLWIEGKQGRPVPEEVKPKIEKAVDQLFDRVAGICTEYELQGSGFALGGPDHRGVS